MIILLLFTPNKTNAYWCEQENEPILRTIKYTPEET